MAADLERFVLAQDSAATFERALAELQAGRKRSHWMWFVFPQLAGLGRSTMARRYAIASLDEARAYLAHPVLGPRLVTCAAIVAGLAVDPVAVFGSVDTEKLRSCMTLFLRADPSEAVFADVLDRHFAGVADAATDGLLEADRGF